MKGGLFVSRGKEYVAVILFFLLVTVAFTWPLALHLHHGYVGRSPDPLLNAWIISWDARTVFIKPTRLFQANILYPNQDTLVFSEHLFTAAVLAAPVYHVSKNPIMAHNFLIFIGLLLSALGCYLLVKELTGSR